MSTQRQKKLAKAIVENLKSDKPKTKGELLENIGYSKNTAEAIPGEIMSAKGVQEELLKYGFDEDSAKKVVQEVLGEKEEPMARLKAADMIFKVKGSYAPEKTLNLNVEVNSVLSEEKIKKINEVALDDQ